MEFLAELLIALVQFISEVLLQIAGDVLTELGWNALREVFRPSHPPVRGLVPVGYSIIGAALGGLSLLVFPKHFAASMPLRLATLALAPIASALAVAPALPLLRRPAEPEDIWRRFWNAYAFSLTFALIRFAYAGRPG
jgi:hypothetical protein